MFLSGWQTAFSGGIAFRGHSVHRALYGGHTVLRDLAFLGYSAHRACCPGGLFFVIQLAATTFGQVVREVFMAVGQGSPDIVSPTVEGCTAPLRGSFPCGGGLRCLWKCSLAPPVFFPHGFHTAAAVNPKFRWMCFLKSGENCAFSLRWVVVSGGPTESPWRRLPSCNAAWAECCTVLRTRQKTDIGPGGCGAGPHCIAPAGCSV